MKFITENKTTVIAISIILLGIVAYFIFFSGGSTQQDNGLVTFGNPTTSAANREFVSLFTTLRQINFDTSIFDNPNFKNLKDFSREVTELPTGRDNPFAPL